MVIVMVVKQNAAIQNSASPKYAEIIDKVVSQANDHLIILMNQLSSSADRILFDLAEKAVNDEEQMKYMDCTRIFITEKNDIHQHFFVNLNKTLIHSSQIVSDSEEALSLVGQDEMEEMVAITTMHAKAMNIYGEEVNHLEARLEYLELIADSALNKEALTPKCVCEIFQKTIENIDLAIDIKLVFYKLFDKEVCSKLGVMFKAINQLLIDNDIMPQIVLKTMAHEEIEDDDEVSTQVASYYDPSEKIATDFIPRSNKDISRIVNEFMSGDMTISENELELPESFLRTPTQQDIEGKNCYQRKEVLKALSSLQRKISSLSDADKCLTTEEIKQELLSDISKENGGIVDRQVNLLDERSIDFVGMMFNAIADDNTVSEIMTSLIYQLQVPVMKVAMIDRTLFDNEGHPARETVDLLTTAGKGINAKEDHLYDELEQVVDDILDKFDIDIESFVKAVIELEKILQKEEELTCETERQQQKQILQEHARKIVITQFKMLFYDKKLPDNVRPLVLKHWSTLMLNRYIRHGRDSTQWLQSVLLLKLLLKCIQPIKYKSQYELLKQNHEALIEAVNDELYETQQDKEDIERQVDELKRCFMSMIDEYGYKVVDEGVCEVTEEVADDNSVDDAEAELKRIKQEADIAKQKIAKLESSARPGMWFEIFDGEDKPVRRLKLSVILTDAAQLIFVNRKGVKVIEKDAEDFAMELEQDRSRVLADHSTFDHALGNVMTALAA